MKEARVPDGKKGVLGRRNRRSKGSGGRGGPSSAWGVRCSWMMEFCWLLVASGFPWLIDTSL